MSNPTMYNMEMDPVEIEQGVKILVEAAEKFKCNVSTTAKALLYYHQFNRLSGEVKFDCCAVAAAALFLSSRIDEEPVDIDVLINIIYNIYHQTDLVLDPYEETFRLLKRSIMSVDRLMWRKFEFDFDYKTPQQYITDFVCAIFDHVRVMHSFNRATIDTSLRFMLDFYMDSIATHYPPRHVALGCISAALECHGIFRSDMNMKNPWFKAFSDLSEERINRIKSAIFQFYQGEPPAPKEDKSSEPYDEFDFLYNDEPPVLTDLRNLEK